ncbi:MAG: acetyl-CoA carboxylase biotin carboxyl carrier protein [Lachnospiraceae bacterium]|nr:acetyl-CoA carboxylase biotin carboxyl carrier protein [Lachnospiraceae bacterium]
MEYQQIIDIIKAVSGSKLTYFELDQGEIYLKMKKQRKNVLSQNPVGEILLDKDDKAELFQTEGMEEEKGTIIKSPLVGTFYAAASPEDEAFVKEGDSIAKGQVLGIIEAMKLMNEIESDYSGTIIKVLVKNGDMVEYGEPLFVVKE